MCNRILFLAIAWLQPVMIWGSITGLNAELSAEDKYGAIAYSQSTRRYGYAWGKTSRAEAEAAALSECTAGDAFIAVWGSNTWLALAHGDGTSYGWARNEESEQVAQSKAIAQCAQRAAGSHLLVSIYAAGQGSGKIIATVPANARLYVGGTEIPVRNGVGELNTAKLLGGKEYQYTLKARLVRGVETLEEEVTSDVYAFGTTRVSFRELEEVANLLKSDADSRSWVGMQVAAIRPHVRFGHTNPGGVLVRVGEIKESPVEVIAEQKPWVKIRQGDLTGWCQRDDLVALDQAAEYFGRRVKGNSEDLYALASKATAHAARHEYMQAREAYEAAARLEPREAKWAEKIADAAEREGNLELAFRAYARVNLLDPARRVEQQALARELVAQRAALAQQQRSYEVRLRALAALEQAAASMNADARQELSAERQSLVFIQDALGAKNNELGRRETRTGIPPERETTPSADEDSGNNRASPPSILDSLTALNPDVESGAVLSRYKDEVKPVLTGRWSPVGEGWFIYEFEAETYGSGKVTRRPGEGNIDSSTKYGNWRARDEQSVILELPESGRPGYSSYSPPVTIDVKILTPSEILIGRNTYRGGRVNLDGE